MSVVCFQDESGCFYRVAPKEESDGYFFSKCRVRHGDRRTSWFVWYWWRLGDSSCAGNLVFSGALSGPPEVQSPFRALRSRLQRDALISPDLLRPLEVVERLPTFAKVDSLFFFV